MSRIPATEFRRVLGHLPTGVCVVASFQVGGPVGMAVNSMTSVSLEPPLILVCPARRSTTWPAIHAAGEFCLSVMAGHHAEVARRFAAASTDRFEGIGWHARVGGPGLDGAVAWLDCRIDSEYPAGDHTIVVAEVVAAEASGSPPGPLVFFRGSYGSFAESAG